MKVYMDMEIQYITEDHVWYRDAYENPSFPFSEYLLYEDQVIIVAINLAGNAETVGIDDGADKILFANKRLQHLFGEATDLVKTRGIQIDVLPYAVEVLRLIN